MDPKSYLAAAISTFQNDPPDTEFQRGYLSALIAVMAEAFDDKENYWVKLGNQILG